jgi:S1-C subfamily serine protease
MSRVIMLTLLAALALVISGISAGWLLWGQDQIDEQATVTTSPGVTSVVPQQDEPVASVAAALLPTVVQLQSSSGLGSGVIYDQDGLILTAAHVVGTDQQVTVRLADGDQLIGEVVGADPNSDIAVVRVDRGDLVAAPLALETELEVGQTAVALGSPYGLEQTVTSGVVSATDRSVVGSDAIVRTAIQTDAPINPGNSGGPLADLQGEVIGINDAIFSQSGGNEGVGFAVPITVAKHVADLLVAGEPIRVAFLGISGTDPVQGQAGALITGVVSGSPADTDGILVGDLITTFEDNRVEGMVDLAAQVQTRLPGDQVTIHVVRGDNEIDLEVTLGSSG